MKSFLTISVMVTTNPRLNSAIMSTRCCFGICSRATIGIGNTVTTKSAKQLILPAASITTSSGRHLELGSCKSTQYARAGVQRKTVSAIKVMQVAMV